MVIFGGGGDLAWRKLVPALYNLFLDGWLPDQFAVIGLDIRAMSGRGFRKRLREGVDRFSRRGRAKAASWDEFASRLSFLKADFGDPAAYRALAERLAEQDKAWGVAANRIFYLAVPPTLIETITERLGPD